MKLMKDKIALAAVATMAFCSSLFGQVTDAVYSVNIIGMQKQPVTTNFTIRSNPFSAMLISQVAGTAGKASSFSSSADNLLLFNPDTQAYVTYYLGSNSTLGLHWRLGSTPQTNLYLAPQQGFFYRGRASQSWTNTVVGDIVLDVAVTNIIRPGFNLLSYPYSTPRNLTNMNLKVGKASSFSSSADNLMIFNDQTQSYVTYYLGSNSTLGVHWRLGSSAVTNLVLEPGQGFFYRSRSAGNVVWVENTPYPEL